MEKNASCSPSEVSLKSFFLGPQAENAEWVNTCVDDIFARWFDWRRRLFPEDGSAISPEDQATPQFIERRAAIEAHLHTLMQRFEDEVPKFSPRYIGHMFSEFSLPALFGHIVTLLHNPNNISGESAKIGTQIEDEAVRMLLTMLGFDSKLGVGHFTSGGTVANFEAVYRARTRVFRWLAAGATARTLGEKLTLAEAAGLGWQRYDQLVAKYGGELGEKKLSGLADLDEDPFSAGQELKRIFGEDFGGPVMLVPQSKHYSWPKGAWLCGLGKSACVPVEVDRFGKMSITDLNAKIEASLTSGRPVMMVVSVAGTTELGLFDPIDEVSAALASWRERGHEIWHHVDGAYGAFFAAMGAETGRECLGPKAERAFAAFAQADSATLDPHKLGYVPFASGAFLTRSDRDYALVPHRPAYVQMDNRGDRGPYTIEGSRSAAGAVATWLTGKAVGFNQDGYGRILARTVRAKKKVEALLRDSGLPIRLAPHTECNVCCFTIAEEGQSLAESNRRTAQVLEHFSPAANGPFIVSQTGLYFTNYGEYAREFCSEWNPIVDDDKIACLRLCIMNPFFDSKETRVSFADEFIQSLRAAIAFHPDLGSGKGRGQGRPA
jgi:glutamate/tyrosine decarboxylase-like PLP-dependent enzyme